jgi:hypothetical protein
MSTPVRPYDIDQPFLLPSDLREWVPDDHLVLFINDVVSQLDLSSILRQYDRGGGGRPAYHPGMLVRLLLHAYCIGMPSSRRIESRLKKIQEAMARLEKRVKEAAAKEAEEKLAKKAAREARGDKRGGPIKVPDPEQAKPDPKAQSNFTDPESTMMLDAATKGFAQSYNALAAMDSHSQIIIATMVTGSTSDRPYLHNLLDRVQENAGLPEIVSSDAGFYGEQS